MELNAMDKIIKAKVNIQRSNPFFARLVLHLKPIESDLPKETPMGIDVFRNLYYNKEFVEERNVEEIEEILIHEVLHCLTPDSLILTDKGLKPISEIKIGERVFSNNGYFTEVKAISKRYYKGKIYELNSLGLPIKFTPEHPILSVKVKDYRQGWGSVKSLKKQIRKRANCRFNKVKDINPNDFLVFSIPKCINKGRSKLFKTRHNYDFHKVFLDEDVAYFLGFFMADGNLNKVKKRNSWFKRNPNKLEKVERHIVLTLSEKDNREKLAKIVKNKFFRSPCVLKVKDKRAYRIIFSSKSLAKFLRNNFYNENEKCIPTWLLYENKEIIKSFIKGLADGDGYTDKKGRTTITSVYKGIYSFVPLLLMKLGIIPSIKIEKRFDNHRDVAKICFQEKRKLQTGIFVGNKFLMPLKSKIESDYSGFVYNLETNAKTYSVPFFIVHNCAFAHLVRLGNRDAKVWNICGDAIVNQYVLEDFLKSSYNSWISTNGITFNKLNEQFDLKIQNGKEKIVEEVYDILYKKIPKRKGKGKGKGDGFGSQFDKHYHIDNLPEKEKKKLEKQYGKSFDEVKKDLEKEARRRLVEAYENAKIKGDVPAGLERLFDKLMKSKMKWNSIIFKEITSYIPANFTWARPSRKSVATNVYLPSTVKESVDVIFGIDTSGSIDSNDLNQFLSEIVFFAKSFNNVNMTLITADCEVQDVIEVHNGNIGKLFNIKVHGGDGSSTKPTFEYIKKNKRNAKLLIYLTDGFIDFPEKETIPTIWVLSKNHTEKENIPFGRILELDR